jgi:tRNA pseudouridine38-40 synthase
MSKICLKNYKMTIAYDGTHYSGWQVQPNAVSIQSLLHGAIKTIIRQDVVIIGSGRTDAGVHALGQTAHFKYCGDIDLFRFQASLNGLLPRDIRVLHVEQVPLDFHAQYSAVGKTYHYHIHQNPVQNPFGRLYSLHMREKIYCDLLQEASQLFVGEHDFTSFANEAHRGSAANDPVRTIKRLDYILEEGGFRLEFEADGFLYKMVRNIVGTLLEVSTGKRNIEEIRAIFNAKDRRQAGQAAPPHGLFLVKVSYPEALAHS